LKSCEIFKGKSNMKTQKLKPIACVLAVSLFLAGCNGGRSTADGSSNSLQAAQAIVNNNDANHAAFIERVKNAVKGPVNYEVINRDFYTPKDIKLAFDPNLKSNQLASEKSLNVSEAYERGASCAATAG
jgi:predicted small secreted protein